MCINYKRKIKLAHDVEMGFGDLYEDGFVRFYSVGMSLNSYKNNVDLVGEYEMGNPIINRLLFEHKKTKDDYIYCEVFEGMICETRGKYISEYDLTGVWLPSRVDRVYFDKSNGDIKVRHSGWGYSYYKWNQDENKWIHK